MDAEQTPKLSLYEQQRKQIEAMLQNNAEMTLDQTIKSPPMSDYLTHPWKSGAQLAIERENVERQFGVSVSTSLSYVNYVTQQESKFGRVAPFDEWHDQYKLAMAREVKAMCRGRDE